MIARKTLPAPYADFNKSTGAPGRHMSQDGLTPQQRLAAPDPRTFGFFGFQVPSDTRTFEYPFAATRIDAGQGLRVLDVGGGLSGLQFLLAQRGCKVTTVDPAARQSPCAEEAGEAGARFSPGYWMALKPADHARINELFGTEVELVADEIQHWDGPSGVFDRVVCLSVLEHVGPAEAREMVTSMVDRLAPGGLLLLTVDLFLDLEPFGVLKENVWGRSHDVHQLLAGLPLTLKEGDRQELLGFPEFDRERVVRLLPELLVGRHYPVMTQALVLEKTSAGVAFS
ncbi:class I SAM-dependent methyltransferase [Streptomyces sp. BHT-5-2]|uniref:class I SAM-dependent methyltransferase n=1 Tax=Streptomyces sp. BHT-5-2 TaxID=2866715 RepID=UPI001C8EAD11|nr:class I SAM-dependent methyltransferase [Streptomyces sp. BHT-5-2]QZL06418.1 class I SAM-dependent methyltransferase [Streptomyces sp. BHT-5-2]